MGIIARGISMIFGDVVCLENETNGWSRLPGWGDLDSSDLAIQERAAVSLLQFFEGNTTSDNWPQILLQILFPPHNRASLIREQHSILRVPVLSNFAILRSRMR